MSSKTATILKEHPLEDLAGQLFCPAAFIHDDEAGIEDMERLIREQKIGGITFFHSRASAATNYEKKEVISYADSLEKLKQLISRYQAISEIPLLISIDAEWGLAMRVEETPQYPYAITLGSLDEQYDDLIFEAGYQIGRDLKSAGIDFNLAPVVDINTNPQNPVIGYRSFGASREKVFQKAAQYCEGLARAGVANSLKHFPGHGDTAVDSHLGLPVIGKSRKELEEQELYPFKKLIAKGVDSVMVGHLAVPALSGHDTLPATLSEKIIKGVLREEMNFEGVVISDALNMHSVSKLYPEKGLLELKAFQAGNDMLCFSENIKEGKEKILRNCSEASIREAVERILSLKEKVGTLESKKPIGEPDHEKAKDINTRIAQKSIVSLKIKTPEISPDTVVLVGEHKRENGFLKTLETSQKFTAIRVDKHTGNLNLSTQNEIVVALYPPHVKPAGNFGYSDENLEMLKGLTERHRVTFLVFGNHYSVQVIPGIKDAANILFCGQHLKAFQKTAARILNGELTPEGKLPFGL
ncbi:glycoside hydrolase family 3 protein [Robertkochia marina]|uniref:beta-N-acetylhexosaminidase n=1 Tax=Robertkochia marina TaxID=1227945 RepID=A0A4S3LY42_9FLAO|nr:glycoside hydrolase family 3 protein [Robertkochia marina]THD65697.1 glycoside hydrolase family 3 protein [Robertkochia marina]TRZ46619.1 glycoside hydrolase family 3 protein [Robertkochia marina]